MLIKMDHLQDLYRLALAAKEANENPTQVSETLSTLKRAAKEGRPQLDIKQIQEWIASLEERDPSDGSSSSFI